MSQKSSVPQAISFVSQEADDEVPPASASENRSHGAEKIGPRRYSDFFNRIGPKLTSVQRAAMSAFKGDCVAKLAQEQWIKRNRARIESEPAVS